MAAKKKKPFNSHAVRKDKEAAYDLLIMQACKELNWPMPAKEALVLSPAIDHEISDGVYPSYFVSPKRGIRRLWRHDYVWDDRKIAVEIDGVSPHGIRNRHQSFVGYTNDCEKHRAIVLLGYRLLRYTPAQLEAGQLLEDLMFIQQGSS